MQSDERASEYYTLAANQGHADAQFNLGFMYANGIGVRAPVNQSFSKAREWFTKAASQGNKMAMGALKQLDLATATNAKYKRS